MCYDRGNGKWAREDRETRGKEVFKITFLNVSRVEKFSSIGNVDIRRVLNFLAEGKSFIEGISFVAELAKWKQFGMTEQDVTN